MVDCDNATRSVLWRNYRSFRPRTMLARRHLALRKPTSQARETVGPLGPEDLLHDGNRKPRQKCFTALPARVIRRRFHCPMVVPAARDNLGLWCGTPLGVNQDCHWRKLKQVPGSRHAPLPLTTMPPVEDFLRGFLETIAIDQFLWEHHEKNLFQNAMRGKKLSFQDTIASSQRHETRFGWAACPCCNPARFITMMSA